MNFKFDILPTDALLYLLVIGIIIFIFYTRRYEHLRAPWRHVLHSKIGMISLVILMTYVIIGLLDSIHFRMALPNQENNQKIYYTTEVNSLLDVMLGKLSEENEESYSAPFSTHLYTKSLTELPDGTYVREYSRLRYGGADLKDPNKKWLDITWRCLIGFGEGLLAFLLAALLISFYLSHRHHVGLINYSKQIWQGKTPIVWREIFITIAIILQIIFIASQLVSEYHIFGTDKVGNDVFYEAVKSIRTGLAIGTLTTLIMLPFAVLLGTIAGYFGGWLDDAIQYVYTTLSSIPAVLLITAAILALQIYIENHADAFPTLAIRADIRLLALCAILGVTSWTTLCRLLRAETLKLREVDFINAAVALGQRHPKIIWEHVIPNVMHIILITVVLDFSGLVLAEAVLSYVGVGVDPTTLSWGNMINSARLELAREPVVWWPLAAAFVFMFILVLAANLFADTVRDAFDPRIRKIE